MNESYCNALAIQDYNQYRISCPPNQLIPYEYQGWFLIGLTIVGTIAIIYSLYLMTGDEQWKKQPRKSGK